MTKEGARTIRHQGGRGVALSCENTVLQERRVRLDRDQSSALSGL